MINSAVSKQKSRPDSAALARNVIYNFAGQAVPMLTAVIAIPFLIHGLGTARFGVLTLAWMVIGYFSLFDLGLSRALTQVVAKKLGEGREAEIPALVWTSLALMGGLGVLGGMMAGLMSPWLVSSVLKIPFDLQTETRISFYLLALSIPVVILTAGLTGILSALQRFDILNAIRIPLGVFNFLGPLLVLPFSQHLFWVILVLVLGRGVSLTIYLYYCLRVMPALREHRAWHWVAVKPLLHFGGWMTVSNVIGPLMVYMDRFLIGAVASVTAVAYYAAPYEIATKLWVVPTAVVGVLFPAFAAHYADDKAHVFSLLATAMKYTFLLLFPAVFILVGFAPEGLSLWLGASFARHSTGVLQWLAVGVLVNSLAMLPSSMIQGIGRPDLTARLHLLELPLYAVALWWSLKIYGIEGAAFVWVLRVSVDLFFLSFLANHFLPGNKAVFYRMSFVLTLALVLLFVVAGLQGFWLRAGMAAVILAGFAWMAWVRILSVQERAVLMDYVKNRMNKDRHAGHHP